MQAVQELFHKEVTKGIIAFIFKNLKFMFCVKFNLNTICKFYCYDFIFVTSLALRTQSVGAVFCPAIFFHTSLNVNHYCEKSERI